MIITRWTRVLIIHSAGEREPEKAISKVASPIKELEAALKDESLRRDVPIQSAATDYEPVNRPKPDKKIFGKSSSFYVSLAEIFRPETDTC